MGREFDIKWQQFEQQAKRSGVLDGMTKAQKQEFYGRMAKRIQEQTNEAISKGLTGVATEPAVMNRAGFIAKYGYDPLVADPLLKDGGKWGGAGLFDKPVVSANPKHPSNTQSGGAHAQPAKPAVPYVKPEVSGVVKNDRIAENIRKGRAEKRRIEQIFRQKPEISAESINRNLGIGKENVILDGMNDNYRFLERRSDYKRALGKHLEKPTKYSPEVLDKLTGHGPNKELDAMGDYYRALEQKGNTVVDNVKKFDWKKFGKFAGIVGVAGLLVGAGILIGKAIQKNKAEKAEEVEPTPVVPVPVPENEEENVTPVDPTPVEPTPVDPNPTPVDPFLPLNPDGTYTTKKGDSFWKIAERNLKDKFRNEPEKFENLSEQEKNAKIQLETRRIMKLNGYTMAEDNWHSAPTLYPNVNIKINETIDVAA